MWLRYLGLFGQCIRLLQRYTHASGVQCHYDLFELMRVIEWLVEGELKEGFSPCPRDAGVRYAKKAIGLTAERVHAPPDPDSLVNHDSGQRRMSVRFSCAL